MLGCGDLWWEDLSDECKRDIGYASYKELSNFYYFLKSLDEDSLIFECVEFSKNKKCIYRFADSIFNDFCYVNEFNVNEFNEFLKILSLYSIQNEMLFQKYDNVLKEEFSIEKVINGEIKYIDKLLNWVGINLFESFPYKKMDNYNFLKFLKIAVLIRYSFNNTIFKFEFIKNKWIIVPDNQRIKLLDKLYFINYDVKMFQRKIIYSGDDKNMNIVDNKNFNHYLWIDKFDQIKIDENIIKSDFLEKKSFGLNKVVEAINFLNSIKFEIYENALFEILLLMENTELHKDCPDMILAWIALNDLKLILNFGGWFYLNFILDTRTRVYCKNIPINPQLIKIIRMVIIPKLEYNFLEIIKKFIFYNDKIFDIGDIFSCLDYIDLLIEIWKDKILSCGLGRIMNFKKIKWDNNNVSIYLIEIVFLQQLMDISVRYSKFVSNKKDMILSGKINLMLKEDSLSKDNIHEYLEKKEIKNWLNNNEVWLKINWFNDASASVIQLLVIKLLITDDFTLKLSNIYENDTEFKDIYDFVRLKICSKDDEMSKWVNRKIVKRIIMPGIYGQKIPKMIDECENILKDDKDWTSLEKKSKMKIILKINKNCWEILKELDLDILKYLNLTRKLAKTSKIYYWISMIDMPIIIGKSIQLDRKKLLKKIMKEKDNIKKIEKLKEKLNKDDTNYLRKNIKLSYNFYKKKYIKIRLKIKSKNLDIRALERGLCPSSIHSEDASILINIIKECSDLKIGIVPIHDSVGSKIFFSSIIKCIYKKKIIEYIDYVLSEKEFPINTIIRNKIDIGFNKERKIKLNEFLKIKEKIIKEIKKSNNIFN